MDIFLAHQQLQAKALSPVELTQQCLQQAKSSPHNSFISLLEDLARETAQAAERRIYQHGPQGYLDGIPFNLKDLFISQAIRTTAGSLSLYNYIPPYQGYVSEKLQAAGGILLGKTGCDEFGMGSSNENTPFGPVLNPHNPQFVAGGSSGGSAASIAEGASLYSMGTDTGGSVRLPANFCGLVGLKPTYGRISRYGQIAYASSLDQAAPMGNSVSDMACILEALTEHDPRDSSNAPLGKMHLAQKVFTTPPEYLAGKKIGISDSLMQDCAPLVKKSLMQALQQFSQNGATLVEVELKHLKYSVSSYYIVATSEASSNLARFDGIHYGLRSCGAHDSQQTSLEATYRQSRSQGFGAEVKRRILLGTYALSAGHYDAYYKKACQVRRLISRDFQQAFACCDAIFSPVCATTAPRLGECVQNPIKMYTNDLYTIPANLAGLPRPRPSLWAGRAPIAHGVSTHWPSLWGRTTLAPRPGL